MSNFERNLQFISEIREVISIPKNVPDLKKSGTFDL